MDAASIRAILDNLTFPRTKLMCHPGYCDTDLVETGSRSLAQREIEIQALGSGSVRNLIVSRNIRLLNYREFAESLQGTRAAA